MSTAFSTCLGMVIGSIFVAWRVRRTAARAAAGITVSFPVGANLPAEGRRRYSLGRVQTGREFRWEPRWSRTRLRELPTDLRYVRARETTLREMLWLPSSALVIECESSAGPVRLWAYTRQAPQVVEMIRSSSTGAPDVDKPERPFAV
ncbi:hypothetical protein OG381_02390 [Streptomyces sp. NBC_00490]|uniref:hypothetical protein n=1 Tax=Streptomyces sp. NBC_00490 TaxID=2903657 RepID=UPI002E183DAD